MRVSGTVLGTIALLLGFYQAPFAHIHADDLDHPVGASVVHWHPQHDEPRTTAPAVSAPTADDDAIDVGWNALKSWTPKALCDFDIAEIIPVTVVRVAAEPVQIPLRRGHDPPDLALKSPRAPPL